MVLFNKPRFTGKELEYLKSVLDSGHWSGDGAFTKKCHKFLEDTVKVKKALLTTSCTDALELSALLLNLKPGDEFIIPSFTFVSTANAFVLRGAKPVFVDIRPDTLNLDENLLEQSITARTRAIVVVHYGGIACEMDKINAIAEKHSLPVVEDNAHGLFGKYKGRDLGALSSLATLSFHETKNIASGEGGALLINDAKYIDRAEILREKGTNRSRFFRGQVDKYTWCDVGSSFLPSEFIAAVLWAQLENHEISQKRRAHIWNSYNLELKDWADSKNVKLPTIPKGAEHPSHLFYMLFPGLNERTKFIDHMKKNEVVTPFHYLPLHLSDMGKKFGGKPGDCPVTEIVSDTLVRLPLHNDLSDEDLHHIIKSVKF